MYAVIRTPFSSACSTSERASFALGASGLSTATGSTASSARRVNSTWTSLGAATTTKSCSEARSKTSAGSETTRESGCACLASACRCGLPVTTVLTVRPGVEAIRGAWKTDPASPYPITAPRRSAIHHGCEVLLMDSLIGGEVVDGSGRERICDQISEADVPLIRVPLTAPQRTDVVLCRGDQVL